MRSHKAWDWAELAGVQVLQLRSGTAQVVCQAVSKSLVLSDNVCVALEYCRSGLDYTAGVCQLIEDQADWA